MDCEKFLLALVVSEYRTKRLDRRSGSMIILIGIYY